VLDDLAGDLERFISCLHRSSFASTKKWQKNPRGGLAPSRMIPNAMIRFKEKAGKILRLVLFLLSQTLMN
jgi:hypothetical protein